MVHISQVNSTWTVRWWCIDWLNHIITYTLIVFWCTLWPLEVAVAFFLFISDRLSHESQTGRWISETQARQSTLYNCVNKQFVVFHFRSNFLFCLIFLFGNSYFWFYYVKPFWKKYEVGWKSKVDLCFNYYSALLWILISVHFYRWIAVQNKKVLF